MGDLAAPSRRLPSAGRTSCTAANSAGRGTPGERRRDDARDLAEYRVIWRRPVRATFAHEFVSNPPPSSGGVLIGYGLRLLGGLGARWPAGSAEAIAGSGRGDARAGAGTGRPLRPRPLPRRPGAPAFLGRTSGRREADRERRPRPREQARAPGTTHISVVDERGNAASLTVSTGSGSGVIVPGTGIHLNNMLGEFDLSPSGGTQSRERLTSMMAPSMVLTRSARASSLAAPARPAARGDPAGRRQRGSARLPVEEAISAPRVHVDDGHVHCEGGAPAELDRLERLGYEVIRWRRRNLYFGGAAAVEVRADGSLQRPATLAVAGMASSLPDWLLIRPATPADAEALVGSAARSAPRPRAG